MLISLDNVNQMVGVREATSITTSMMVNSTGGFATPVFGIPGTDTQYIPKEWLSLGARVQLDPRMLGPSQEAVHYMISYHEYYMAELLSFHIGSKFPRAKGEYRKPEVEVLHLVPNCIYPFELMDIEQSSIDGNLRGISRVLIEELGYSRQELMEGLFLVGGDQLLLDRVRSIQRWRESDVPGEDFSFVLPILGPFHTAMNYQKSIMKYHWGNSHGKVPGSLSSFNKILRR